MPSTPLNWLLTLVLTPLLAQKAAFGAFQEAPVIPQAPSRDIKKADSEARIIKSEVLGVSLMVPPGAKGNHVSDGDASFLRVQEGSTPPQWVVTVRILRMPESGPAAAEQSSPGAIAQLFITDAMRVSPGLIVLEDDSTNIQKLPATTIRAKVPHESSGKYANYQWSFIQTGPNRFLLAETLTPADSNQNIQTTINELMDSMQLDDEFAIAGTVRDRLKAGAEILSRIDKRILRKLVEKNPEDTWYRQYAFNAEGEEIELGYVGISMMETTADQIGRSNPQSSTEDETGLLVRVRSHRFPAKDKQVSWDTDTQCWVSWDREEESFSTVATGRIPNQDQSISLSVVGVRPRPTAGQPVRFLEVLSSRADSFTRDRVSLEIPDSRIYISEAERLVLANILPLIGAPAGSFSVWGWQPDQREITRRLDTWELEENGTWSIRTRSFPDAPVSTAKIQADGSVSDRVVATPDGREIWTRMDPDALRSFYRKRGIRLDS